MKALAIPLILLGAVALGCAGRDKQPYQKADSSDEIPDILYGNPVISTGSPADALIALPFAAVSALEESKINRPDDTISGTCRNDAAIEISPADCEGLFVQIREGSRSLRTLPMTKGSFLASGLRRGAYRVVLFKHVSQPLAERTIQTGQSIDFTLKDRP